MIKQEAMKPGEKALIMDFWLLNYSGVQGFLLKLDFCGQTFALQGFQPSRQAGGVAVVRCEYSFVRRPGMQCVPGPSWAPSGNKLIKDFCLCRQPAFR
jgi:hypothetical protein